MTSKQTPHTNRILPFVAAASGVEHGMRGLLAAVVYMGLSIAMMAPTGVLADPIGDAATSGWDRQAIDIYRGFFLPGVAPFTNEFDSDKMVWLGLPCNSARANAPRLPLRSAVTNASSDTMAVCTDMRREAIGAR